MAADWLSVEQRESYGRFAGEPTRAQLDRYFWGRERRDHSCLTRHAGLLVCDVRFEVRPSAKAAPALDCVGMGYSSHQNSEYGEPLSERRNAAPTGSP